MTRRPRPTCSSRRRSRREDLARCCREPPAAAPRAKERVAGRRCSVVGSAFATNRRPYGSERSTRLSCRVCSLRRPVPAGGRFTDRVVAVHRVVPRPGSAAWLESCPPRSAAASYAARRLAGRPVARLVDLGSGAGHVVIYAAALAPNVTATGHELAAGRHRAAVRARAALPSSIARRCAFVEGDMLRADLSRAVHESNCRGASSMP